VHPGARRGRLKHGGEIVTRKTSVLSKGVACLAVLAMLASGCAWAKENKKTAIGGAGGATAGGLIAAAATSNPAAIAGAVILGGLVGGAIGNRLDQRDKELAIKQGQQSLNSGQPASWSNPDSGNSGTITPTRTYQEGGTTCREYRHDVMIGDDKEQVTGTACRQADGTWKKK
jgi:surface antigen